MRKNTAKNEMSIFINHNLFLFPQIVTATTVPSRVSVNDDL